MNIEEQLITPFHAKKLSELGLYQDSIHFYQMDCNDRWEIVCPSRHGEKYSAFTASELMDMLPSRITLKKGEPFNSFRLRIEKSFIVKDMDNPEKLSLTSNYIANYYCDTTGCTGEDAWLGRRLFANNISDERFADCLAKVLVYLVENDLYGFKGNR